MNWITVGNQDLPPLSSSHNIHKGSGVLGGGRLLNSSFLFCEVSIRTLEEVAVAIHPQWGRIAMVNGISPGYYWLG